MKKGFMIIIITVFCFSPCFAVSEVRITGGMCIDVIGIMDLSQVSETILNGDSQFWGLGWEVLMKRLSIGGNYYSNFLQDTYGQWTVAWYAEIFYMSYHIFKTRTLIDPFLQIGIGNAGGVFVGKVGIPEEHESDTPLTLCMFPYISGGAVAEVDGLILGAKLNFIPRTSGIPLTGIEKNSLNQIQILLYAGIAIKTNKTKEQKAREEERERKKEEREREREEREWEREREKEEREREREDY